jgi:membrane-bound ClpP family serine protease
VKTGKRAASARSLIAMSTDIAPKCGGGVFPRAILE